MAAGNMWQKIVQIAAGEAHTLALTGDGSVYSWGRGTFGRLGSGNDSDELFPTKIEFDLSKKFGNSPAPNRERGSPKFVGIAAGAYHSLALEDDGSVWSWGYNICQLGFSGENASVPCLLEKFLGLGSPGSLTGKSNSTDKSPLRVCSVKAGGMMSFAIDSLGALWMWGNCPPQSDNYDGEFSLVTTYTPVPVWDFHGHTVVKVACGNEHIVALVSAGETSTGSNLVYSWGNNSHGQLGLGDKESRVHPEIVETFDLECPWVVYEIACGAFHTAVLTRSKMGGNVITSSSISTKGGECVCWTFGLGDNGQLGHGTTASKCLPEAVKGLPQDSVLVSIDCGLFHTCAVFAAGDLWAWGMEKGLGLCPDASFSGTDSGDALSPFRILPDGPKFANPVQVACGAAHTVLVAEDGYKLWTWGRGRSGVLGRGNTTDSFVPCVAMWPPLNNDFNEDKGVEAIGNEGQVKENQSGKVMEMEKKLAVAVEGQELLQSKLAVMERYASILHASIFGKPFHEGDLPSVLRNWGTFSVQKEWENIIESADEGTLVRMEAFYQNMLAGVKDKLMKRRIEGIIQECLRSLPTGSQMNKEDVLPSQ